MRVLVFSIILFLGTAVNAQGILPLHMPNHPLQPFSGHRFASETNNLSQKKWFVSRYSALSTGFTFFNGGSANYLSVPFGLQLNRRLSNNWYAFAGVAAAPAYIHFNRTFQSFTGGKPTMNNGFLKANNYGIYSKAEMGLMYINEDKTFSISGSIGVQRSSNPVFFVQPVTTSPLLIRPAN